MFQQKIDVYDRIVVIDPDVIELANMFSEILDCDVKDLLFGTELSMMLECLN